MNHNVSTVLEGTNQVGRGNGVVHDERQTVLVRHVSNKLDVEHVDAGVTDRLGEEQFCVRANGTLPLVFVVLVLNEGDLNAEFGQCVLEQVVGATVDRAG
ncbi:unannotated protein [freshwater metagenome]|uniref:Unannotated protein n=1 Tax=freshwater metagenome TaxID=449393 RepID=A0A6J7FZ72_9ZZZZ